MTTIQDRDFEDGSSPFTTNDDAGVSTTSPIRGTRSWRASATADLCYSMGDMGADQDVWVGRFYFRYDTFPATDNRPLFVATVGASSFRIRLRAAPNKLSMLAIAGTVRESAEAISTGTIYRIDFRAAISGTTLTIDWQIDGVDQTQATGTVTAGDKITGELYLGNYVAADTMTLTVDDLKITDTSGDYPLGAVTTAKPAFLQYQ